MITAIYLSIYLLFCFVVASSCWVLLFFNWKNEYVTKYKSRKKHVQNEGFAMKQMDEILVMKAFITFLDFWSIFWYDTSKKYFLNYQKVNRKFLFHLNWMLISVFQCIVGTHCQNEYHLCLGLCVRSNIEKLLFRSFEAD